MGEIFYLDFKSDNFGLVEINEPIGFASIDFNLNQKDKAMGRDISFNGGETQFEFVNYREHYLDQLLYYVHTFGFEAKVNLIIEKAGVSNIIGELDFATSVTDDLKYFKCKVMQESNLQVIKRRKSVKVDLLSNKDADGNFITPLNTQNVLMIAKPVYQTSRWEQTSVFNESFEAYGTEANSTLYFHANPCVNVLKGEIEETLTFFEPYKLMRNGENPFEVIKAKNALKKIQIEIKDVLIHLITDADNGNGYVDFSLEIAQGLDFATAAKSKLLTKRLTENQTYDFEGDFSTTIDTLNRGESIWIYFYFKVRQSGTDIPFVKERFECRASISNMKTEIKVESNSYNSITPSFRLVDVMRQVIKSISGLDINAPRFDVSGQFYDNRLFDGNFLRNVTNKSFYVSLEDLEKSITEMNGDYEIQTDGRVFFGIEQDFYTGIESGFFDNTQFSEMSKTFNPKYSVNEFNYSYKNYQSQKENEELNSADTVHGESRWVFFNKRVENKKEVAIEWTRDAFLIEATRRKALEITESTASQDDNSLFAIDTINTTTEQKFTEVTSLNHTYNKITNKLTLQSDGGVNFIVLGVQVNTVFTINPSHLNAGNYNVVSVVNNALELSRISTGAISLAGDGVKMTNYTYTLDETNIPYTSYTNQGFTAITNLNASDKYSNLRYSVRRNINNYYQSYLATCNLYWKNKPIINTWYKNNGDCSTTYLGKTLIEKSDLTPSNPLVTPFIYDSVIFANVDFEDFLSLQNSIRSDRGYIRTIDNNNQVVKLFPVTMRYENLSKELTIKGEEKYEPIAMRIVNSNGVITVNNETKLHTIIYEITDNKVLLFDSNRQRLYNGVFWDKVSVNGATAQTINELKSWMDLL
jgi:hypothetical protein